MSYEHRPDGALDQGDLIRRILVCRKTPADLNDLPDLPTSNIFVLSHGCDIDKARFDSILVARVIRLSAVPDSGRVGRYFVARRLLDRTCWKLSFAPGGSWYNK